MKKRKEKENKVYLELGTWKTHVRDTGGKTVILLSERRKDKTVYTQRTHAEWEQDTNKCKTTDRS